MSDEDFESFDNVTVGTASQAVLTPFIPSHCFTITLLARPDDRLDDQSFYSSQQVCVNSCIRTDLSSMYMYIPAGSCRLPPSLALVPPISLHLSLSPRHCGMNYNYRGGEERERETERREREIGGNERKV